jgi:cysteinyl-tRNA synthetase
MAAVTKSQPAWQAPSPHAGVEQPPLRIWNSLTRSKTPFTPLKPGEITWYACGPTVYDDAHLGHARNYVTTDIIRRILKDYFKWRVKFVMNITDVDDKIILRGRQQYILSEFKSKNATTKTQPLETAESALKAYFSKNLPLIPTSTIHPNAESAAKQAYGNVLAGGSLGDGPPGDKEAKIKMHIKTVVAATKAMNALEDDSITLDEFYDQAQDLLLPYLDSLHGSFINADDHSIFTKLTQTFEDRFMEDVRALNCEDPDVVTRVTEYVPQIADFVDRIQKNGFAYVTSDGSVYFDIDAFEKANNHYARLEPWSRNDTDLRADGEGSLTKKTNEKKSDADFALWKNGRPGEPSWDSSWGKGRPGWHIECSAMASDVLGKQIDIHSGGIDLSFPHHDNELAQSEAYWSDRSHPHEHQWVNYFLHMGHLSISGSKMSKSLKNFTTIRDALSDGAWTPRSLRIVFLYGGWREGIEVTSDVVLQGASWEERINTFFIQVNDVLRRRDGLQEEKQDSEADVALSKALEATKKQTYDFLCDSFNTREVMKAISDLTSSFFVLDQSQLSTSVVRQTAVWITQMVNTFGLNGDAPPDTDSIGWSGAEIPAAAAAYIYPLADLRDELRRKAMAGITTPEVETILEGTTKDDEPAPGGSEKYAQVMETFTKDVRAAASSQQNTKQEILRLCDRLRDVDLFELGLYLEDREGEQPALVRPLTKEIIAARKQKEEEKQRKEEEKQKRLEAAAEKARLKADKDKVAPGDMFRTDEYSEWDQDGMPTKEKSGEEVNKSKTKKLRKLWEAQKKAHEGWLKSQKA